MADQTATRDLQGQMSKCQTSLRELVKRLADLGYHASVFSVGEALKEVEEAKTRLYTSPPQGGAR